MSGVTALGSKWGSYGTIMNLQGSYIQTMKAYLSLLFIFRSIVLLSLNLADCLSISQSSRVQKPFNYLKPVQLSWRNAVLLLEGTMPLKETPPHLTPPTGWRKNSSCNNDNTDSSGSLIRDIAFQLPILSFVVGFSLIIAAYAEGCTNHFSQKSKRYLQNRFL